MGALSRMLDAFRGKAAEGEYRPGPWPLIDGSWLPAEWGQYRNFWQLGYDPIAGGAGSAMVEACVSAYAQTIAMCQMNHWRDLGNGGRERVTNSALARVMRAPNDYQTSSDFKLNAVRSLFLDGNAYALALRNDRFEISSLHLMHPRYCRAEILDGEIFYALGGNSVIDARLAALDYQALSYVPARDVFHVKLQTPRDVLRGDTPLTAAALAQAVGGAALSQAVTFFGNQSRPSGVLQTDVTLTPAQVAELRERWDTQAKGLKAGGTPILTSGLKWEPISVSQADAQFAEVMKYSDQQVAEVFRVPLAIIGSEAQPMGSTEALMNFWIGGGLGFALNQFELAIDKVFGLARLDGEYSELDTSILLRSAFKERIEGLARAVQGGIYSPNEARALESLPAAKDGDEPRVQQQVVPLSAWDKALTKPAPVPALPPPDKDGPDDGLADKVDELDAKMTEAMHALAYTVAAELGAVREKIDDYGNVIRLPGPPGEPGQPGERGERGERGEPGYSGSARGLFDPAAQYRAMDVVTFNGSEWRAKIDAPGELPGPGWVLGAKGSRGKRGERGPAAAPAMVTA
jgi:HK97 family phage portal protein